MLKFKSHCSGSTLWFHKQRNRLQQLRNLLKLVLLCKGAEPRSHHPGLFFPRGGQGFSDSALRILGHRHAGEGRTRVL